MRHSLLYSRQIDVNCEHSAFIWPIDRRGLFQQRARVREREWERVERAGCRENSFSFSREWFRFVTYCIIIETDTLLFLSLLELCCCQVRGMRVKLHESLESVNHS